MKQLQSSLAAALQKALDNRPKWEKQFEVEDLHDYASECHEWFEDFTQKFATFKAKEQSLRKLLDELAKQNKLYMIQSAWLDNWLDRFWMVFDETFPTQADETLGKIVQDFEEFLVAWLEEDIPWGDAYTYPSQDLDLVLIFFLQLKDLVEAINHD